jgi:hypothetical protein
MGRIASTQGAATAHFVTPVRVRAVARWTPNEIQIVCSAIAMGRDLDETHAMLPHRSRDSVKDQFYKAREAQLRGTADEYDEPQALWDARRQKDAREGSARLLDALRAAGYVVDTGKAA